MENEWTPEHEVVLADWADKSVCYKWLHLKSNEKYHSLHIWYTIPVIVMSTLTGTANFAQDKIPENFRNYATMIIGGINILAGIITTIQQFLKINELNEAHRVASISWDKFYRRLKVELSKNPSERQPVLEFFNRSTDEYDRLMEASPMIDEDILSLFKTTFDGSFTKESIKNEFNEL
jgi:type III secretory pathway component EscR